MLGTNSLIVVLVVGLVSGWLAAKIVDGTGLGIIADIIIGVIGAFIGRWLFSYFHIRVGVNFWVDAILTATFGAIVLLVVIRLIKRA
ncbi:MAG TPA: GlsB/YeaQ/YmgE family stress response membrane protein [Xanthobacteraceae bacterium]|nr:GlsB/YeaQ/YmgE family stress response membrane protein [Xanthobacteraceae bacterium]